MKKNQRKKMQLTTDQRVFVVVNYHETKSLEQVKQRFRQRFPDRNAPTSRTILKNVRAAVREMRRRAADCVNQNGGHVEGNL